MKKVSKIIWGFLVVCLLFFGVKVDADMGAPSISSYDVIVTNTNGTTLYDTDDVKKLTIPYDTKLTVIYEYKEDGVLYANVNYSNEYGYIKLADTKMIESEINLDNFTKDSSKTMLYVFRSGCYMFSGPSANYEKITEIPVGTTLEYEYHDEIWAYVTYNGKSGWIFNYRYFEIYDDLEAATAVVKDSSALVIDKVSNLYEEPDQESKKISVNIPSFKEVDYKYYYYTYGAEYIYVTYNNVSGWLYIEVPLGEYVSNESTVVLKEDSSSILTIDEVSIYSAFNDTSSKVLTVPNMTELVYNYCITKNSYNWYQVVYNDKIYWIREENDNYHLSSDSLKFITSYQTESYRALEDLTLYTKPTTSSDKIEESIPEGEIVIAKYFYYGEEDWYYVEYNDIKGWVEKDKIEYIEDEETEESSTGEEEIEEESDIDNKMSQKMKLCLIASGIVILVIVSCVTIKLVNKKKNNTLKDNNEHN